MFFRCASISCFQAVSKWVIDTFSDLQSRQFLQSLQSLQSTCVTQSTQSTQSTWSARSTQSTQSTHSVNTVKSVYSVNSVNFSVSTVSTFSQAKYLTESKCEIFQDPSVSTVSKVITVSTVLHVSQVLQNLQVVLAHLSSIMSTLHWWLNPWSGNIPEKPFWANCSICWPAIWWCIHQDWPNLETEISTQLQSETNTLHYGLRVEIKGI